MPSSSSSFSSVFLSFCLLLGVACADDQEDIPASRLDFMELLPTFKRVEVGESFRLAAQRVKGATTENVTSQVTLRSDDEAVLQVEGGSVVRAVAPGTAHVTAEHDGAEASAAITVITAVSAVELDLVDFWLASGTSKAYGAVLIAGDEKRPFDEGVWSSLDPEIASVDAAGQVTGHKPGETTISLSRKGSSTLGQVRVEDAALDSVQLQSSAGTKLVSGRTSKLTVEGNLSSGGRAQTQDLTEMFALTVEADPDVLKLTGVSVSAGKKGGTAKVIANGKADTIAAGQQAELEFEVTEANKLQSVRIDLPVTIAPDMAAEIALGMEPTAYKILGEYGVGAELETTPTELSAGPTDVIEIRPNSAVILPLRAAEATLGLKVTVTEADAMTRDVVPDPAPKVRVVDTALSMLSISPNTAGSPASTLSSGQRLQLEATAHYGTLTQAVTEPTLWTSSDPTVAVVNNVHAGLVTALKPGSTTLQARYHGLSAEYELVVEP